VSPPVRRDEPADGVVRLTLDRAERRNALDTATLTELHRHVDHLAADASVRAVVLTGEGDGFCAGADMKAQGADAEAGPQDVATAQLIGQLRGETARLLVIQEHMAGLFEKLHRLRIPVIAAVNGAAVGGGLALALACDLRIAAEEASFGASFIHRGVSSADMGTSYFLPRLVGASRAAELMLTGRTFDAAEAQAMGLVCDVVSRADLPDRALALATTIAGHAPLAVWMTKEVLWQSLDAPSLRAALDLENRTQILCTTTGELTEAFAAFRDGRRPEWKPL
jgi:enoyl-CoA hydratase